MGQYIPWRAFANFKDVPWRFGGKEERESKDDGWNHLQAPWDTEGRRPFDVATSIRDVEHDHDTPCDGPLLSTDHTATLARRRKLGDINRNCACTVSHVRTQGLQIWTYLGQSKYRH